MSKAPPDVALAATLHDPPGALADAIEAALPRLAATYRSAVVATTPHTSTRIAALLATHGMHVGTTRTDLRGPLYRLSLRGALATGAARVHYLDFDRALRWLGRTPRELRAVLRLAARHRVLLLGRTPKAHRSHHLPLYATEALANRLMAARLGLPRALDLLVPSFVVEGGAAARLLARSRARDSAMYGEWAALLLGLAPEVAYLECRGLDWETPDRHRRAIRRLGLPAWRRRQETPAEWARRVAMAADFLAGFARALARGPAARPVVRALAARA